MLRKLRIFFTFSGIILLIGTIVTDEWDSFGERMACALMAIIMLAVCQPSALIRFLRWLAGSIASMISKLLTLCRRNSFSKRNTEDAPCKNLSSDAISTFDRATHTLYEYDSPTEVSRGNISILTDDEMHIFLQHYYKADEIKTKVRGVSFRNDDGTDRQCILAHCHAGDQLRFKRFEYEGAPAYAVYCDWGQIGNLAADLAEDVAARQNPCIMLGEILNVSGGYHGEYFGCNICLSIYEKY